VGNGQEFQVAVCLEDASRLPASRGLNTLDIRVSYGPSIAGIARNGDGIADLSGNPDFNEDGMGGADWDCNLLDEATSGPQAPVSPAKLTCSTNDVQDNQVDENVAAIAVIRFRAAASGSTELSFVDTSSILSSAAELLCLDGSMNCDGATISVS
jgi:hypothetical protein